MPGGSGDNVPNSRLEDKTIYCSFCGKSQHEVDRIIAGPAVFICGECVDLCEDIIREEGLGDGTHVSVERPTDKTVSDDLKSVGPGVLTARQLVSKFMDKPTMKQLENVSADWFFYNVRRTFKVLSDRNEKRIEEEFSQKKEVIEEQLQETVSKAEKYHQEETEKINVQQQRELRSPLKDTVL